MLDLKTLLIAGFAVLGLAGAAAAQTVIHLLPPEQFKYLTEDEVKALTDKPGPGSKTATVSDHENYFVEHITRSDAGNVTEIHAHWTDYIQILTGEGVLTWGGTVADAKERSPGEVRGGTIVGGTTRPVHVGDFILIPPGTPHLFTAAPGTKIRYIVFKGRL